MACDCGNAGCYWTRGFEITEAAIFSLKQSGYDLAEIHELFQTYTEELNKHIGLEPGR